VEELMSARLLGVGMSRVGYPTWRAAAAERKPWGGGFTLMELLVVLAVIATLAGLLLPALAQVQERARQTTCLSHLQQLSKAHLLYLQDWDERFPDWRMPAPPRPHPFGPLRFWPEFLAPYLRPGGIYHDPGAVWQEGPGEGARLAEYALVTWGPGGFGWPDAPYFRWPGPNLSLADVVRPSQTVTMMDGWTTTEWTWREQRHGAGGNCGFVDGHCRWLSEAEFFRLESNGRGFYWMLYGTADR
jgi:prepilin-type N-terminal cleavage/methylation domain-containing protein/prepilin-type processing-associated H-X9-DG protein